MCFFRRTIRVTFIEKRRILCQQTIAIFLTFIFLMQVLFTREKKVVVFLQSQLNKIFKESISIFFFVKLPCQHYAAQVTIVLLVMFYRLEGLLELLLDY
jgi:hypothetical protein